MSQVIVAGRRLQLTPSSSIGKGGEADVYQVKPGIVLKVFKRPDHPDYEGQPHEQEAARERIKTHQAKLRDFPRGMPKRVIVPLELATDPSGIVIGYTMEFVSPAEVIMRLSQPTFRNAGVSDTAVMEIFRDLHPTVVGVHRLAVVGDFNDLNVLINGNEAYIIDADSFQYEPYFCTLFTQRFVDPMLCDPHAKSPMLVRPHNPNSDWYAFAALLFQSLLLVDPYGGAYLPKSPSDRLTPGERPLKRVTVFHPQVRYPKKARHWKILPDDWVEYFQLVFGEDRRGEFPLRFLEEVRWTKCPSCGADHARRVCPECAVAIAAPVMVMRKGLTVTQVFTTRGVIRFAQMQGGKLHFVYHDASQVTHRAAQVQIKADGRREPVVVTHSTVQLPVVPQTRFRVQGQRMLIGLNGRLVSVGPNESPAMTPIDSYQSLPMFDANETHRYWLANGRLLRDGQFGEEVIGEVLAGQTLFWVGPRFGFGFYRAGNISVSFLFDERRPGINDESLRGKLPPMRGQVVDSTCVFTGSRCWFFLTAQEGARKVNRVAVIRSDGTVEATAEADEGDGSWLGSIHGKCATGTMLFAPTDDGVVRLEVQNGQISQKEVYQGTEAYVQEGDYLHLAPDGSLFVVKDQEILELAVA